MTILFPDALVVLRGGGDLASGVAYRLHRAGFPVAITELAAPIMVRRTVSYGAAVFEGQISVEGITARRVNGVQDVSPAIAAGEIPVLVDTNGDALAQLKPTVLIDARMSKTNTGTSLSDAPFVLALGPGFSAAQDCHAVIETNRGHNLGRVIWQGPSEPDTGTPGSVAGYQAERIIRAPRDGRVTPAAQISDVLDEGQLIASVDGAEIIAPFRGALRGLVHPTVQVSAGLKIGDLDPRAVPEHCFTISDKSLAIGGGALEAILASPAVRERLPA